MSRRHRLPGRVVLLVLCAAVAALAAAPVASASGNVAGKIATELWNLEPQFMCVSCHEPLNQVSSPQAQSEKSYISSLLRQGKTPAQIKRIMVSQYGPEVLAQPPANGFNLTIYVLPPAVLLVGLGLLAYMLPRWRRRSRSAPVTPLQGTIPLRPEQAERLDQELTRLI